MCLASSILRIYSLRRATASTESRFAQSRQEQVAGSHLAPRFKQMQYLLVQRPFLHVQGFRSSEVVLTSGSSLLSRVRGWFNAVFSDVDLRPFFGSYSLKIYMMWVEDGSSFTTSPKVITFSGICGYSVACCLIWFSSSYIGTAFFFGFRPRLYLSEEGISCF